MPDQSLALVSIAAAKLRTRRPHNPSPAGKMIYTVPQCRVSAGESESQGAASCLCPDWVRVDREKVIHRIVQYLFGVVILVRGDAVSLDFLFFRQT